MKSKCVSLCIRDHTQKEKKSQASSLFGKKDDEKSCSQQLATCKILFNCFITFQKQVHEPVKIRTITTTTKPFSLYIHADILRAQSEQRSICICSQSQFSRLTNFHLLVFWIVSFSTRVLLSCHCHFWAWSFAHAHVSILGRLHSYRH